MSRRCWWADSELSIVGVSAQKLHSCSEDFSPLYPGTGPSDGLRFSLPSKQGYSSSSLKLPLGLLDIIFLAPIWAQLPIAVCRLISGHQTSNVPISRHHGLVPHGQRG